MTIRYLHVRQCDYDGKILNTGGLTVAYTVNETLGAIFMNWALCSPDDMFCYKTGREIATDRLRGTERAPEVVEFAHPISEQVRKWVSEVLYNGEITLIRDERRRTLTTFDDFFAADERGEDTFCEFKGAPQES